MKKLANLSLLPIALFCLLECNKPTNYLYYHPTPRIFSVTQKVHEVTGNNDIDILWAVGGMTEQAANFQAGTNRFMSTFITKPYSWRQMVISSNTYQPPFLGSSPIFDNTDPNPVQNFTQGIYGALNGTDAEQIFDPIVVNLNANPNFLRPNATLVVILTNDDYDHSTNYTLSSQMLSYLIGLKGGDPKKVLVYGVFGSLDLNCQIYQVDSGWTFHGTEFEKLINATGGKMYSLCDAAFGDQLSKIGDDLYRRLDNPRIPLDRTPDPDTIHVLYHGTELPGGDQTAGGLWYYDSGTNSIIFYNVNFAKLDTDEVTVSFTEELGVK